MASLRRTVLAPDAEILVRSAEDERRRLGREALQDDAQAAALHQMLTGQAQQAQFSQQAKQREGEQSLAAINEFLRSQPTLADRLGRRAEGPMPEGVAGPGSPVFQPYTAGPGGAGFLADIVKGEVQNVSAEGRQQAQLESTLRNLFLKEGFERENLEFTEGGKDRRLGITEEGKDERFYAGEAGKESRFVRGEKGKTVRSAGRDAAIAGEATYRAQLAAVDDYMKRVEAALSAARLEVMTSQADPARNAAAKAKFVELSQQLEQARQQYNQMLQPRGPAITQPTAPTPSGPVEEWTRGPDGKLIRVQ